MTGVTKTMCGLWNSLTSAIKTGNKIEVDSLVVEMAESPANSLNLDETGLEEISQDGTALSEKIMPNGSGIQPNRGSDDVLDGSDK